MITFTRLLEQADFLVKNDAMMALARDYTKNTKSFERDYLPIIGLSPTDEKGRKALYKAFATIQRNPSVGQQAMQVQNDTGKAVKFLLAIVTKLLGLKESVIMTEEISKVVKKRQYIVG